MRKTAVLVLMLLALTGCATPVWETVEDTADIPAAAYQNDLYSISLGVPQQLQLLEDTDQLQLYTTPEGDFEVETVTFYASSPETAIQMLTGYHSDRLNILETERFGLPEYQFAWVSQTEQGTRICRADLLMDGTNCYAVVCSTAEAVGNTYEEPLRQVISSFGLYTDEGV